MFSGYSFLLADILVTFLFIQISHDFQKQHALHLREKYSTFSQSKITNITFQTLFKTIVQGLSGKRNLLQFWCLFKLVSLYFFSFFFASWALFRMCLPRGHLFTQSFNKCLLRAYRVLSYGDRAINSWGNFCFHGTYIPVGVWG